MIEGLSHITFMVRDLDRMEEILISVLGAKKVYDSGDNTFSVSRERFYPMQEHANRIYISLLPSLNYQRAEFILFSVIPADAGTQTCNQ